MAQDANVNVQLVADNGATPPEDVIINIVNNILQHTDNKNKYLTVRVVEADEIQALNMQFRGKDSPTNVLSFPSGVPGEIEPDYLGDIVICASVVEHEASIQGKRIIDHPFIYEHASIYRIQ